jgi:sporulation protein YlmC with PRC-barrel domain
LAKAVSTIVSWLVFFATLVAAPSPADAQQPVLWMAVMAKSPRLSQLQNRSVWNDKGQRVGAIADFIVNNDYALFAVLQIGGFLAVGGYLVAVPFKIFVVNEAGQKIVLPGATREAMQICPECRFDGLAAHLPMEKGS